MTFVWIIIIGGIIWGIVTGVKSGNQMALENKAFAGEHQGWDIYTSAHERGVIAIDHDKRLLAIGTVADHSTVPWSAIGSVEIERNGQSISQTNRGSQVMGAAVGALLLGPLGLLVGGLTGSKRQKERVNELALKLTLDDRAAPVRRVVFFKMAGNGLDARAAQLKEPVAKLEHFHALLMSAIRTSAKPELPIQEPARLENSSAREIADLWQLVQAGALSQAEFDIEKRALLSGRSTGEPAPI